MAQLYTHKNLAPSLRRMSRRPGPTPRLDTVYPCLQLDFTSPSTMQQALLKQVQTFEQVVVQPTDLAVPDGLALVMDKEIARGQPEAFIIGREFAIVRPEGSIHLLLAPAWGQKVLDKKWATIHPLARYMAGAIPPQTLVVYAPRHQQDLKSTVKILEAAYCFARGEVEGHPLPDTAW